MTPPNVHTNSPEQVVSRTPMGENHEMHCCDLLPPQTSDLFSYINLHIHIGSSVYLVSFYCKLVATVTSPKLSVHYIMRIPKLMIRIYFYLYTVTVTK